MRIVFTCGVFDMFHEGHKNLINLMREEGDYLVVFIHNDKSTYKNKGKFPVQNVTQRMRNMLFTGLVDKVIEVRSADPTAYFESFQKEHKENDLTYYRGDDWKDFPGKDCLNCEVKYVPYTEGVSSTKLRSQL